MSLILFQLCWNNIHRKKDIIIFFINNYYICKFTQFTHSFIPHQAKSPSNPSSRMGDDSSQILCSNWSSFQIILDDFYGYPHFPLSHAEIKWFKVYPGLEVWQYDNLLGYTTNPHKPLSNFQETLVSVINLYIHMNTNNITNQRRLKYA